MHVVLGTTGEPRGTAEPKFPASARAPRPSSPPEGPELPLPAPSSTIRPCPRVSLEPRIRPVADSRDQRGGVLRAGQGLPGCGEAVVEGLELVGTRLSCHRG